MFKYIIIIIILVLLTLTRIKCGEPTMEPTDGPTETAQPEGTRYPFNYQPISSRTIEQIRRQQIQSQVQTGSTSKIIYPGMSEEVLLIKGKTASVEVYIDTYDYLPFRTYISGENTIVLNVSSCSLTGTPFKIQSAEESAQWTISGIANETQLQGRRVYNSGYSDIGDTQYFNPIGLQCEYKLFSIGESSYGRQVIVSMSGLNFDIVSVSANVQTIGTTYGFEYDYALFSPVLPLDRPTSLYYPKVTNVQNFRFVYETVDSSIKVELEKPINNQKIQIHLDTTRMEVNLEGQVNSQLLISNDNRYTPYTGPTCIDLSSSRIRESFNTGGIYYLGIEAVTDIKTGLKLTMYSTTDCTSFNPNSSISISIGSIFVILIAKLIIY